VFSLKALAVTHSHLKLLNTLHFTSHLHQSAMTVTTTRTLVRSSLPGNNLSMTVALRFLTTASSGRRTNAKKMPMFIAMTATSMNTLFIEKQHMLLVIVSQFLILTPSQF